MLLNPIPGAKQPERIVAIENLAANGDPLTTSYLDFLDFRNNVRALEFVNAHTLSVFSVGNRPRTERIWGDMVSGNFFAMLGLKPEAGRFFAGRENDDAQNTHTVVVISHTYWKTHYGLARSAIGATLRLNRTPLTIIALRRKAFTARIRAWTPRSGLRSRCTVS